MPTIRKAKGWEWKWLLEKTRVSGVLSSIGETALMFFGGQEGHAEDPVPKYNL